MRRRFGTLFALMALALCAGATAAMAAPQLAAMDGARWLTPGDFDGQPATILFWSPDCPPCRIELANLAALQAADPENVIILAAIGRKTDILRVLGDYKIPKTIRTALAPNNPRGLLARLGNKQGALPFTVRFDGKGRTCAFYSGALSGTIIDKMRQACTPPPARQK